MYEPEAEEALGKWSSSKYAELEGEPPVNTAWRRGGVKWLHVDRLSWQDEEAPHILRNPQWVEKTWDDNYLCGDFLGGEVRILSPAYETVWSYDMPGKDPYLTHEHPTKDYILISDWQDDKVIEVDRSDKSVLNSLTSSDLGSFDNPMARYDMDNPDRIFVADYGNHVAEELSWDGTVHNSFGEYGTAGSDATHLDSPRFASPNALGGVVGIADQGNDRILLLESDWTTISRNMVVTGARSIVRAGRRTNLICGMGQSGAAMLEAASPFWWPQTPQNSTFASWAGNLSVLLRRHGMVEETDIRSRFQRRGEVRPHPKELASATTSLAANATSDPKIFWTFTHEKTVIAALSTESATLEILALEGSGGIGAENTPRTWHTYDEVSMTADEPEFYVVTGGMPVMAGRVTMGGTAGNYSLGGWRR